MQVTNLTPEVDIDYIEITQTDINRPALQLADFFDYFDKRRDSRREAAYAKWENKPENAEYKRLVDEIAALDAEIATCKGILKDPTSYMGEMG